MIFMLGYFHREHQNKEEMFNSIDTFLENIFIRTGSDQYYGAIAGPNKCFRYDRYKVKPYKGNRAEQAPYMDFWRPICTEYLVNTDNWSFDQPSHTYEADDLIGTAAVNLTIHNIDFTVCSPDKDLRTIVGFHYDYRKDEFCKIDEHHSSYNFFKLMIEGDDTDNIAGIPGYGPKKVKEKLDPLLETKAPLSSYVETVRSLYHKHFGEYYGGLIYQETFDTVALKFDMERKIQIYSVPQKAHPFEM